MAASRTIDHLFIVGAGFSQYAGLPLTTGVTKALLDVEHLGLNEPSVSQVELLKTFVADAFDHALKHSPDNWPYLEDIFTCIDLSANTGHHLGPNYAPSDLRTVRRALIVRIIRMLQARYSMGQKNGGPRWQTLQRFFKLIDPENCAFLSMNWDTVIEQGVTDVHGISNFDYACDARHAAFAKGAIKLSTAHTKAGVRILKPHGSSNWLYCDSCRQLFWFSPGQALQIANQLFKATDWNIVKRFTRKNPSASHRPRSCPGCGAKALGTRFATFSYRKALDFPMHGSSWRHAEQLLREAKTWTFIGYSLPAADYEFKLLLKRVQLSRKKPAKLIMVTGGDALAAQQTQENYMKFFGSSLAAPSATVFLEGLEEALEGLQKLKVLEQD